MREHVRTLGLFALVLLIVTAGRWGLSSFHIPYEQGTDKLSIFVATVYASLFYGAFSRRWRGYGIGAATTQGLLFGLIAQLVVLLSTALSYALGLQTYFNHPIALNAPEAPVGSISVWAALLNRLGGLIANSLLNGIAGALGWVLGWALPAAAAAPSAPGDGTR